MVRGKATGKTIVDATKSPRKKEVPKKPHRSRQYDNPTSPGRASNSSVGEERLPAEKKDRAGVPAQTPTKPRGAHNSGKSPAQNAPHWTLSPVVVSPAESDTSYGFADRDDYPWDSLRRPQGDSAWEDGGGTPLTPPMIERHAEEKTPIHLESPLARTARFCRTQAGDATVLSKREDGYEDEELSGNRKASRRLFQDKLESEPKNGREDIDAGLDIKDINDSSTVKINGKKKGQKDKTKGISKNTSVQKRSNALPEYPLLGFIIPFDVHERYSEASGICVACKIKKPYERCKQRRASKGNVLPNVFLSLRNCGKYYRKRKYDKLWNLITDFVETALCHSHCNTAMDKSRMGAVKIYLERLSNNKEHTDPPGNTFTTSEFERWIEAISGSTGADSTIGATSTVKSNANSNNAYDDTRLPPIFAPPRRTDSYRLEIIGSGQPKSTIGIPTNEAIFKAIWQVLTPRGKDSGNPNYRKIGFSKNAERRKTQWDADCGRHHDCEPLPEKGYVFHARRVEKLIHAELKDVRMRANCDRCERGHCEWFEVTKEHLTKVFVKWQTWIKKKPYEQDVGSIWSLKADMTSCLKEVCEPLKLENKERRSGMAQTIKVEVRT
ncbi:hypothetical protein N0V90_003379 [Kalmusia sp. IMI 367209]|nr:hypothetical protein N0V90_003379 [Kalmusia sp. IMI 367209]